MLLRMEILFVFVARWSLEAGQRLPPPPPYDYKKVVEGAGGMPPKKRRGKVGKLVECVRSVLDTCVARWLPSTRESQIHKYGNKGLCRQEDILCVGSSVS